MANALLYRSPERMLFMVRTKLDRIVAKTYLEICMARLQPRVDLIMRPHHVFNHLGRRFEIELLIWREHTHDPALEGDDSRFVNRNNRAHALFVENLGDPLGKVDKTSDIPSSIPAKIERLSEVAQGHSEIDAVLSEKAYVFAEM